MIILGIESSCDETAMALVGSDKQILSNIVSSQLKEHKPFGGVVPEIAARAHLQHIDFILEKALEESGLSLQQIDAVAASGGPGLIGGVIVGVMMAKGLSMSLNIPFVPVNHLEAHALTPRLTEDVPFPYLLLLASGGHCQFLVVEDVGDYTYLGGTLDDAIGECIDKTARLLGHPYPGGPIVERLAREGDPLAFSLPTPLKGQPGCAFSFSGLKTAARKLILENDVNQPSFQHNFCASFQKTISDVLIDRCGNALHMARELRPEISSLIIAGGVAANQYFKEKLSSFLESKNVSVITPPLHLCTDNGAMVAWAGLERLQKGLYGDQSFEPRPRWPLEELKRELREKIS